MADKLEYKVSSFQQLKDAQNHGSNSISNLAAPPAIAASNNLSINGANGGWYTNSLLQELPNSGANITIAAANIGLQGTTLA